MLPSIKFWELSSEIKPNFHKAGFECFFLNISVQQRQKILATFCTAAEMMAEDERQEEHFLFPYCNSHSFSIFALSSCISHKCSFTFNNIYTLYIYFYVFLWHPPHMKIVHLINLIFCFVYNSLVLTGLQNTDWVKRFFELSFKLTLYDFWVP